jgi:branched-chain amino acid transport system ATP-binding protein
LLVSEQNVAFARRIADRAFIIESGHIRFSGTMAELDANASLSAQYLSV